MTARQGTVIVLPRHVITFGVRVRVRVMVRTQIQLSEDQVVALKRIAASQHKSMAAVIRQAVDLFARLGETADQKQPRERALRAAGRFKSGTHDLAEKHDDYLAEAFSE